MDSPIRVLHAVVNMNRGGAETLLMNLYRRMDRSKVQFDFLTCKEGAFDEEIKSLGGRIHRIPYIDQAGHRGYMAELRLFFQAVAGQYDILHAHMDRMSGLVLHAAKRAAVPIRIAHSHNTRSEGHMAARLYKWHAGLYIASSATHRFACSQAAADWLFGRRGNEATLLSNGVDLKRFAYDDSVRSAVRAELGIGEQAFVIGHVGRFNRQKNHALLLDIFRSTVAARAESLLVMAGDGPLRPEIQRKARELGVSDKVRLLGVREDIDRLMQAFDVFVFPSHHEGLPVTLIEAQAAGLPCIVSDTVTTEADTGAGLVTFVSNRSIDDYAAAIAAIGSRCAAAAPEDGKGLKAFDIRHSAVSLARFYLLQDEVSYENGNGIYANL